MFCFMQKLLEFSMKMDKSSRKSKRVLGKLLGVCPVLTARFIRNLLRNKKVMLYNGRKISLFSRRIRFYRRKKNEQGIHFFCRRI